MRVGIAGMCILSPGGCDSDDLVSILEGNSNIKPVVYGKEGEERCFGYASLLPENARNGFDANFFGMYPAQVMLWRSVQACENPKPTCIQKREVTDFYFYCRQPILIPRRAGSSKAYGIHYLTPARWMLVRYLTRKWGCTVAL